MSQETHAPDTPRLLTPDSPTWLSVEEDELSIEELSDTEEENRCAHCSKQYLPIKIEDFCCCFPPVVRRPEPGNVAVYTVSGYTVYVVTE